MPDEPPDSSLSTKARDRDTLLTVEIYRNLSPEQVVEESQKKL